MISGADMPVMSRNFPKSLFVLRINLSAEQPAGGLVMAEENVPDIDPIQGLEALPRLRYLVIKYGNIPLSPQDRKKLLSAAIRKNMQMLCLLGDYR